MMIKTMNGIFQRCDIVVVVEPEWPEGKNVCYGVVTRVVSAKKQQYIIAATSSIVDFKHYLQNKTLRYKILWFGHHTDAGSCIAYYKNPRFRASESAVTLLKYQS